MLSETILSASWWPSPATAEAQQRDLLMPVRSARDQCLALADGVLVHRAEALGRALLEPGGDPVALVVDAAALAAVMTKRVLDVDLHDEQLVAGIALSAGCSVQMRTGEGKTFAAIIPALVFGLCGQGVHVVTANPYLAERDASWSGAVLRRLGLDVGATLPGMSRLAVREAYAAHVTFGADREFGFDYLRDGLWLGGDPPVQRPLAVAIVDEADAVLLDQARTPLVLSAASAADAEAIATAAAVASQLSLTDDIEVDLEHHRLHLTDDGIRRCDELLGVADLYVEPVDWPHRLDMAMRARLFLARDRDYVVADGTVQVVDELTGRIADGRRWSEGLHQAVEAKEGLAISGERRSVGRITVRSYFSGYRLLVGMSGTLDGADDELGHVYGMRTVVIPTHRPVLRVDHPDLVCDDAERQRAAVAGDAAERHRRGQPVLIGTRSIRDSRAMSQALASRSVPHEVLSAQNPATEAAIIADAGRLSAVTVATQMAGRGVDIVLGGLRASSGDTARVRDLGGLMVWGVGHHPGRRLDLQLRGRAGRQGDPGESRFAVAPTDDVSLPEQRDVERLDVDLREELHRYAIATDEVQRRVAEWRRTAQVGPIDSELQASVAAAAAAAAALGPVDLIDGLDLSRLPRRRTRRAAALQSQLSALLDLRAAAVGGADVLDAIARLTLGQLLVLRWPDMLDAIDTLDHIAHLPMGFAGDLGAWTAAVRGLYREFESRTRVEWLAQLAAMRIEFGEPSHAQLAPALKVATRGDGAPPAIDTSESPDYDTLGMRVGRWLRSHFGVLLTWEPPVVLVLDAVGDLARSGPVTLALDLEEPRRSVVFVSTMG